MTSPEPTPIIEHANVHEAMAAAYHEIRYIQMEKGGPGQTLKYKYLGEADLINAVRPIMLKHGLFFYPTDVTGVTHDSRPTQSGGSMTFVRAVYHFTLAHSSGTSLPVAALGEGMDTADKASPKSATIALKYALRQLFLLETGTDPDDTPSEAFQPAQRQQSAPQQRRQALAERLGDVIPDATPVNTETGEALAPKWPEVAVHVATSAGLSQPEAPESKAFMARFQAAFKAELQRAEIVGGGSWNDVLSIATESVGRPRVMAMVDAAIKDARRVPAGATA